MSIKLKLPYQTQEGLGEYSQVGYTIPPGTFYEPVRALSTKGIKMDLQVDIKWTIYFR